MVGTSVSKKKTDKKTSEVTDGSESRELMEQPPPPLITLLPTGAESPLGDGLPDDDEITSYKMYRRDSRLLGRIGALLPGSQPAVIAHFRRDFENLYSILIAEEHRRLEERRRQRGDAQE